MRYVGITFRGGTNPNFNNMEAWITKNSYAKTGLYGQCTWFAWGRFYELYGYDPGFTGNGWDCVDQLLAIHSDKFERSTIPESGSVFSGIGRSHVGIVINWNGTTLTIQDGNYDGVTNTFEDAKADWKNVNYNMCDASVHDAAHDTTHDASHDTSVISKQNLLLEFCADPKSRDEMQAYIDVSSRSHFSKYYLKPLLSSGKLEMMFPDKPKSKNQKYTTVHSK